MLSEIQNQIFIGSMLGDGYINPSSISQGTNYFFAKMQSNIPKGMIQGPLSFWKYNGYEVKKMEE